VMVQNDLLRLEVKRLRATLTHKADEVFTLENRCDAPACVCFMHHSVRQEAAADAVDGRTQTRDRHS
jgi:hypothetical protein